MSLASGNSSTPSSVLLHSAVPADYHLIFTRPPLFATEPFPSLNSLPVLSKTNSIAPPW